MWEIGVNGPTHPRVRIRRGSPAREIRTSSYGRLDIDASDPRTSALVEPLQGTVSMLDGRRDDGLEVLVRHHVRGPHGRSSPVQLGQPFEKLKAVYGLIHG